MDNTALLQAINEQNQLLKQLIAAQNKPKLGLNDDCGIVKIYCNRSNGCNWYRVISGEVTPINATALTGYLKELKFEKTDRRGKEVWKLLSTIQADRTYILESGHDSHFSKSLIAAIANLSPIQLKAPITISPRQGDDDQVLFARVWLGSEYIKGQYFQDTDFRELAKTAIANVNTAQN